MKHSPSFEVSHIGKSLEKTPSDAPFLLQQKRKIGTAISTLLGTLGMIGCAQNDPAPATSPAQTQSTSTSASPVVPQESRRDRLMREYEDARGGLPAEMRYSTERTDSPELSEVFAMADDAQSFLLVQRGVLQARLNYLEALLERVNEHAAKGTNFTPTEIADITTALQELRASYIQTPTVLPSNTTPETEGGNR